MLESWGWTVFPLTPSKTPRVRWSQFQKVRPTGAEVDAMFRLDGVGGIGVVTGRASGGLVVRDFDDADAYERWAGSHPDLAASAPTAQTRRGYHVYTIHAAEVYAKFADGEVIGDSRHYVVAPPSSHPSGIVYRWQNGPPGRDWHGGPVPDRHPTPATDPQVPRPHRPL